ncbi:hypothetical protein [Micromonospora radicis]|uniref:hypothetical protein n=1 Tax=Micromonospora radicis TaxID=1894971 RepID=UPI0011C4031B|nr:hypothetical protein [Micromonospora radicis]
MLERAAMGEDNWTPFYARQRDGREDFFRLHDGVPDWLKESLWSWLSAELATWKSSSTGGYFDPNVAKIREVERLIRIGIGWSGSGEKYSGRLNGLAALRAVLYKNDMAFLTAVDYRLSFLAIERDRAKIARLEGILKDSASKWRVSEISGKPGLGERIDETVQMAAESLATKEARAGELLADAWRHAFSMNRDPSAAYRCAVRAVEAAAGPALTPSDQMPTLGKMISVFRDKPEKWDFAFTVDSAVDPKKVLLQMLQLLWTNEYSRHVDPGLDSPLHVTQGEAESAVMLALTVTSWFSSGAICMRDGVSQRS